MNFPARPFPKPPAQVTPYVDILGLKLTLQLLLSFGGAEMIIPQSPNGRSRIEELVGPQMDQAFAQYDHLLQRRVPLANTWVAACLHFQGLATNEIARHLVSLM